MSSMNTKLVSHMGVNLVGFFCTMLKKTNLVFMRKKYGKTFSEDMF